MHSADRLVVRWDDGPPLYITLAFGDRILQEAIAISKGHPQAVDMHCCNKRLEVRFDNLDEVLDEINTLIQVQIILQEATQGIIFNNWNDQLN